MSRQVPTIALFYQSVDTAGGWTNIGNVADGDTDYASISGNGTYYINVDNLPAVADTVSNVDHYYYITKDSDANGTLQGFVWCSGLGQAYSPAAATPPTWPSITQKIGTHSTAPSATPWTVSLVNGMLVGVAAASYSGSYDLRVTYEFANVTYEVATPGGFAFGVASILGALGANILLREMPLLRAELWRRRRLLLSREEVLEVWRDLRAHRFPKYFDVRPMAA